jgi:hypothetical protein
MNPPDQPTGKTPAELDVFKPRLIWDYNYLIDLKATECATLERELTRLRAELSAVQGIRAEKAEAALAFIAENGGTTHETECGTISCNGSWCAEQARAALAATEESK